MKKNQDLLESMRIPFQAYFDSFLTFIFSFKRVEAFFTITIGAELAISETIAIQFQTLRFRAVTVLAANS